MDKYQLKKGYLEAAHITKRWAKTFYFASKILPPHLQKACYCVYAVCRISDDAVDTFNSKEELNKVKERLNLAYGNTDTANAILLSFRQVVNQYKIPKQLFDELLEGVEMDLEKKRFKNFSELYEYCYLVAGVVGLLMVEIFGFNDSQAKEHAIELGIAMQLTNILRDIKEDYARGRIYLPQEEMKNFNVEEKQIKNQQINENFKDLMKFQIKRSRNYYNNSKKGTKMVKDLRARLCICLMRELYSGILKEIERNQFNVFSQRAHLNLFKKTMTSLLVILQGGYL